MNESPRLALTIAGFDPSGGAGVLADVRTFAAFGFTAAAAVTSITFQNRERVFGVRHETAESVRQQLMPLLADSEIACIKTGMLPTSDIIRTVADLLGSKGSLPAPVIDPVMVSSSGHRLMEDEAVAVLVKELFPIARLITPNLPEAERLTGMKIASEQHMQVAARRIRELGARSVLIKGGHLNQETSGREQPLDRGTREQDDAVDVLDNEGAVRVFHEKRVANVDLHGSGCLLSSAIAAALGNGLELGEAIRVAKKFVLEEIRGTAGIRHLQEPEQT